MNPLDPVLLGDRPEHRVTRDALLEALLAAKERLGVTRLAVHTGLDRVGVPIAAAIRPNSRSLAVHQGRGIDLDGAKVSALMEAAECWHAETWSPPLRFARWAELDAPALDPARLPVLDAEAASARLLWTEARDLCAGAALLVPFELVGLDFTEDGAAIGGAFQATSNGLGAGTNLAAAAVHALLEAIERDEVALWQARSRACGRRDGRIDLARAAEADLHVASILTGFAAADTEIGAWLAGSAFGTSTVFVLAAPRDPRSGAEATRGSACDPDPLRALLRALTEAAQARLARIAGARDDYDGSSFEDAAREAEIVRALGWLGAPSAPASPLVRSEHAHEPASRSLADLAAAIATAGLGPIAWCDLSRGIAGIRVVRVVVEGFEGACGDAEYRPGPRARAASLPSRERVALS